MPPPLHVQTTLTVSTLRKKCSREITLWTCANTAYKREKTKPVCCIKQERGRRVGKETVLQLKEEEKSPARSGNLSPEINYHLFSLAHIQVKVRLVTPFSILLNHREPHYDHPAFPEGEKVKHCHVQT